MISRAADERYNGDSVKPRVGDGGGGAGAGTLVLLVLAGSLLSGCATGTAWGAVKTPSLEGHNMGDPNRIAVANGNIAFALDVYRAMQAEDDEGSHNLFFSP